MKVTEEMVRAYSAADYSGAGNANWEDEHVRIGLAAVLALIEAEVQPFAFAGYEASPVYIHARCGTVLDVPPGHDDEAVIAAGDCDCETPGDWRRIYVKREGASK